MCHSQFKRPSGADFKALRPIAKKRNIELVFESIRQVSADVDEVKLSLALTNLVENAIKYNHEDGWVHVTLDADHKFFYVKFQTMELAYPRRRRSTCSSVFTG